MWFFVVGDLVCMTTGVYAKPKFQASATRAYQVFLQSTSAKVHEDRIQNGPPIMPEIKSMKLFPWKDVIMRLVLIRSLSSTKHLLTGKNRKALFYTFALSPLLAFPKVITRLTSDGARKLVGVF